MDESHQGSKCPVLSTIMCCVCVNKLLLRSTACFVSNLHRNYPNATNLNNKQSCKFSHCFKHIVTILGERRQSIENSGPKFCASWYLSVTFNSNLEGSDKRR